MQVSRPTEPMRPRGISTFRARGPPEAIRTHELDHARLNKIKALGRNGTVEVRSTDAQFQDINIGCNIRDQLIGRRLAHWIQVSFSTASLATSRGVQVLFWRSARWSAHPRI